MPADRTHRDVKVHGVRLRVVEAGDGPVVVLLHGLFMDHRTWDAIVGDLSREFRVVAPDLPGFGDSEKPPANKFPYDVDSFAEVVADLYAGLDLGRAAVVGHALGGAIAIALAARHPELVSRLVLVDSMCFETPLDLRMRIALLPFVGGFVLKQLWSRGTFRGLFRDAVLSGGNDALVEKVDRYYDAFNGPASRGSALATLRATHDTRAIVAQTARIDAPTLVVWGRNDRSLPPRLGRRLAHEIRGAGFELLDAAHAPHEELPDQFSSLLLRFLRDERASGAWPLVVSKTGQSSG
jgi:pimeloyl-ACP methyl ester carboxylesterase